MFNPGKTEGREFCPRCGCLRTYSSDSLHPVDTCRPCGFKFPPKAPRNQGEANSRSGYTGHQLVGACPECGSLIHYETKNKRKWECADCGKVYPAARQHIVTA